MTTGASSSSIPPVVSTTAGNMSSAPAQSTIAAVSVTGAATVGAAASTGAMSFMMPSYPGFMFPPPEFTTAYPFTQLTSTLVPPTLPPIVSPFRSTSPSSLLQSSSPFHGHLSQTCNVKLTRDNYLLWRYTILPIVRGHKLEGFLLGTKTKPPNTGIYNTLPNPAVDEWVATDQLLSGWLLSSMTEQVLIEIMGCETSHEIWSTLEVLFNNQSEARMLEYKNALTRSDKGSKSMSDYLAQMKSYSDGLAAAGYPISKSELILAVLGGLDKDYEAVIVNITSRIGSLTWPEVQSQLLTHERLLARFNPAISTGGGMQTGAAAHLATYSQSSQSGYRNGGRSNNSNRGRSGSRGGRGRGGRSQGRSGSRNGMTCQVCGKNGHTALECWHRFEEDFQGPTHNNNSNGNSGGPKQISAYVATPGTVSDDAWYLDSGATNHVTADLGNMSIKSNYNGQAHRDSGTQGSTSGWSLQDQSAS